MDDDHLLGLMWTQCISGGETASSWSSNVFIGGHKYDVLFICVIVDRLF